MGGRGSSSGGKGGRAPSGYKTTGKVGSVKIIRDTASGKGLPNKSAQKNAKYLGTNSSGKVTQLRIYDKNKNARKDIDWGHGFDGNAPGTVHSHLWKNGNRLDPHNRLTKSEIKRYKKLIEEATGRSDLKWEW